MQTKDQPAAIQQASKEFENLLKLYNGLLRESQTSVIAQFKRDDYAYRLNLFSEYYAIDLETIQRTAKIPPKERVQICTQLGVNRYILRTLFDYNRYLECFVLFDFLNQRFEFRNKNILDFGCLVADYGFYFGMLGMHVTLCDIAEHVNFADFRLNRARIHHVAMTAPVDYQIVTANQHLAVFSEVLEHLKDPFLLLEQCVENNVDYIFTSCYPYGDEAYFSLPGHTKEAEEQAPACIQLLRKNYHEHKLMKNMTIWERPAMA